MKFIKSFKRPDKKFIYVILADLAFYAALILSAMLFAKLAVWTLSALYKIPLQAIDITKIAELAEFESGIKMASSLLTQFKTRLAASIALAMALLISIFSICKGIAWSFVKKQKMNKKYFKQFFKLNIAWFIGAALLALIISKTTVPSMAGLINLFLIAIVLYLMPISYALFNPKKEIKEIFIPVWKIGILRIYYFVLPMLGSFAFLLLGLLVLSIPKLILPKAVMSFLLFAGIIAWTAWIKYYLYTVLRGIK